MNNTNITETHWIDAHGTAYKWEPAPGQVLVEVQPHRGDLEVFVDYPEAITQRLYAWLASQDNETSEELYEALEDGELAIVLAYDKQWATVTPLADLEDAAIIRNRRHLERAGSLLDSGRMVDDFIVHIIADPEDDFLSPVDLRTIGADELNEMRRSWPIDSFMLEVIEELLGE